MTTRSPRQSVQLTNPDRVLYEEQGTTKRDVANYYMRVAGFMLPYVEDRLLTLVRCPEGLHRECFFQKHAKIGMPDSIRAVDVLEKSARVKHVAIDDVLGLVGLVQMGVLEIHTWGSAERIAHAEPERYVTTVTKSKRKNKIFIDYLRNSRGATAIAPFSTRALPGAPVATPLSWRELERSRQMPQFDIVSVCKRLKCATSDPWQDFFRARKSVTLAMRRAVRAA